MTLNYYHPENPPKPSGNWVIAAAFIFAGVVVPAVSFTAAFYGSPLSPDWQNGEPGNLLRLQLEGKVAWPFFPLLLYSMISLLLATVRPQRFSHLRAVRLGVYSGAILAAQYLVIMHVALGAGDVGSFLMAYLVLGVVPIVIVLIARLIVRNFRNKLTWALGTPFGIAALVLLLMVPRYQRRAVLGVAFFDMLGAGPLWALIAYAWLSIKLWREKDTHESTHRLLKFVPILGWLAAYGAAWKLAILRAATVYASLPTTAPGRCYICTAAANGHQRLVGARMVCLRDGSRARMNEQLCRLKLAELALLALMPRVHRLCRSIYDALGPFIASRLRHPLAADLAYLSLKPAEWISLAILRLIIENPTKLAQFIYCDRGRE